ncbi:MAG: cytidine deaminase [Chloroflexota bacterium]
MTETMLSQSTIDNLIAEAIKARDAAYVPYSHFAVGAAVLAANGRIYRGCNIENAAYGLTNCAERTALFKAVSEGAGELLAIAVVTPTSDVASPCGACRQVMAELGPRMTVILANLDGKSIVTDVATILPGAFDDRRLREGVAR